jgi:hypothetical protein
MEREQDEQIEGKPWQVEQGRRRVARQERAHGVEVTDRLCAVVAIAHPDRQTDHRVVDAPRQRLVESLADAQQQAGADQVDQALAREQDQRQHRQPDQRRDAAAGQHAVVDLEHEEGARQHEYVAHATEQPDARESPAAGSERDRQLGARSHPPRHGLAACNRRRRERQPPIEPPKAKTV